MPAVAKHHLNYFSGSEQGFAKAFEDWRTQITKPFIQVLIALGITPNMISGFGLFILVGFVYFLPRDPITSIYFLLAHVLLDAFDGSLARALKKDGDAGALTDIVCDHTGMVIFVLTLTYYSLLSGVWGLLYVYFYTIMIVFIIWLNRVKRPLSLAIRTKYYFYILYGIWAIWGVNYFNAIAILFCFLMSPSIIVGYQRLQHYLKTHKKNPA